MRRLIVTAVFLLAIPAANADGLDLYLSNNTASANYLTSFRGANLGVGFLFNNKNDWVANVSLLVLGRNYGNDSKVEGGFGAKLFAASVAKTNVAALGVGGQAILFPRSSRFGFGGYGYFAPDIVTSGGRSFLEAGLRAEYQMMETASIYVGYEYIAVEPGTSGTYTVADGPHIGVDLRF